MKIVDLFWHFLDTNLISLLEQAVQVFLQFPQTKISSLSLLPILTLLDGV